MKVVDKTGGTPLGGLFMEYIPTPAKVSTTFKVINIYIIIFIIIFLFWTPGKSRRQVVYDFYYKRIITTQYC
jgi:hypothetical protein